MNRLPTIPEPAESQPSSTHIVVAKPPSPKSVQLQETLVNFLNDARAADPELKTEHILNALTNALTGVSAQFKRKECSFQEVLTNLVGNVVASFSIAHRQVTEMRAKEQPGG